VAFARRSNASNSRRWALWILGAAALVVLGVAIGSRIAAPNRSAATTTVVRSAQPTGPPPGRPTGTRTEAGAVAAAARSVDLLDRAALLDANRIGQLVDQLAAASAREGLTRAYEQGAAEARARLGTDSVPAPVVILRSALVGYRVDSFSRSEATVAVWRVGIVGSGAALQPQQAWRTETVSLLWEAGGWKVTSFASAPGPTPPLPPTTTATGPGELFREIPRFREFSDVLP
jgi:hypothetical protein